MRDVRRPQQQLDVVISCTAARSPRKVDNRTARGLGRCSYIVAVPSSEYEDACSHAVVL